MIRRSPLRVAQGCAHRLNGGPQNLYCQDIYFIQLADQQSLSEAEWKRVQDLLHAPISTPINSEDAQSQAVVIPRQGLITGWSEKATEILWLAQLSSIQRVEKGLLYTVLSAPDDIIIAATQWISTQIDPMLQQICWDLTEATELIFNTDVSSAIPCQRIERHSLQNIPQCEVVFDHRDMVTDVELAMFLEVNSEHCRHHIFRSHWQWNDPAFARRSSDSLMEWVKRTTQTSPDSVLSAYQDNSAVLRGHRVADLRRTSGGYKISTMQIDTVLKVETHNHPTGVCPFPGAATGVGGEIRDEVATGRGAQSLAGVCGYMVSHLCLNGYERPWENLHKLSPCISDLASAKRIMMDAPLGAARYGNEYGRALVAGFFRTLLVRETPHRYRGFHKPLMICGGIGAIKRSQVTKHQLESGDLIVVLGGAGMKIGLGGGSLSSTSSSAAEGQDSSDRDHLLASVQRENPQMQRRAYHVVEACFLADHNPIISIHDVGAGGLANAVPELVHDSDLGADIDLHQIPVADHTMSPKQIWCNESQERYVIGIKDRDLEIFKYHATRERAPFAVIGKATLGSQLRVYDHKSDQYVVDLDLNQLFAAITQTISVDQPFQSAWDESDNRSAHMTSLPFSDPSDLLQVPSVGDKSFLITIADRTVGGRTVLEPMVGAWQIPVADAGVVLSSYKGLCGQVISMGEKPQVALVNPAVASRLAASEAIMNALCADIVNLKDISFSANWQVDFSHPADQPGLWEAVQSLSEFCCDLGIAVPVGKDSMSMKATVQKKTESKTQSIDVIAPVTLVITATAPVADVTRTLTPVLDDRPSHLVWVNLSGSSLSLGCSSYGLSVLSMHSLPADVTSSAIQSFFKIMRRFKQDEAIYAYHDISDGGLFVAALEMALASGRSLELCLDHCAYTATNLYGEGVGALVQVAMHECESFMRACEQGELQCTRMSHEHDGIHRPQTDQTHLHQPMMSLKRGDDILFHQSLFDLRKIWSRLSVEMMRRRDNPYCVDELWEMMNMGVGRLFYEPNTSQIQDEFPEYDVHFESRPLIAILREQGVHGHMEMAHAFYDAGFEVNDVHMSECIDKEHQLDSYVGFAAVGGFSYGDVLGAGRGWATVIQNHPRLRESFQRFFNNPSTFALGVCNGCQMLSYLRDMIDGGEYWPQFCANESGQFESRTVMVSVRSSPSIMWRSMEGMKLPVVVAHGEGRADYQGDMSSQSADLVGVRYCALKAYDPNADQPDESQRLGYPMNPNGSCWNVAGVTSADGRVSLMMPHPERNILSVTNSWQDPSWGKYTPWRRMFRGARRWVDDPS